LGTLLLGTTEYRLVRIVIGILGIAGWFDDDGVRVDLMLVVGVLFLP